MEKSEKPEIQVTYAEIALIMNTLHEAKYRSEYWPDDVGADRTGYRASLDKLIQLYADGIKEPEQVVMFVASNPRLAEYFSEVIEKVE